MAKNYKFKESDKVNFWEYIKNIHRHEDMPNFDDMFEEVPELPKVEIADCACSCIYRKLSACL